MSTIREITYTRGNAAGRAKRCEYLYKRIYRDVRKLEAHAEGQSLARKIVLYRQRRNLQRHQPRLKALWICYTWLAEDAAAK